MSDLDILHTMLTRAGVVFTVDRDGKQGSTLVTAVAKEGPRNLGYSGFFVEWWFDPQGVLQSVGVWE